MSNHIAVFCKKELRSFFDSPIAYIVITVFLLISGWFFFSSLFLINQASMRNLFGIISLIFMFFVPAVTMRLISEEKRSGTIEILLTLPVKDYEIILGKFLAGLILIFVAVILTLIYTLSLAGLGNLDFGSVVAGYLGLIFLGATYLSIGVFTSSLTQNQIVAFITSFVIIFALYMLDKVLIFLPSFLSSFFEYLSVDYHFSNISRGVIDSRDVIYYLSLIFFFLFLAVRALESRKWR
ncbi:MAG: ABC transporter permease subunit [candidate division Zixibacteria bacterium]|nr:ABC transporter permease subunit [candidate division Zixibacteria bacterium]